MFMFMMFTFHVPKYTGKSCEFKLWCDGRFRFNNSMYLEPNRSYLIEFSSPNVSHTILDLGKGTLCLSYETNFTTGVGALLEPYAVNIYCSGDDTSNNTYPFYALPGTVVRDAAPFH